MLPDALLSAWLAALAAATAARAACTSDLLIDNFMGWTRGVNNLDWPNGGLAARPPPEAVKTPMEADG